MPVKGRWYPCHCSKRQFHCDYSTKTLHPAFSRQRFSWAFVLADVKMPILDANFLAHCQLLVSVTNSRHIDISSFQMTPLKTSLTSRDIAPIATSKFQHLQENSNVFRLTLPKYGICHYIKMTGPPFAFLFVPPPPVETAGSEEDVPAYGRNGPMSEGVQPVGLFSSPHQEK